MRRDIMLKQQERMKEERWRRGCCLHHWCLSLLQKRGSRARRVEECQRHPYQLACLTSIRCLSNSCMESLNPQILARATRRTPRRWWRCLISSSRELPRWPAVGGHQGGDHWTLETTPAHEIFHFMINNTRCEKEISGHIDSPNNKFEILQMFL